MSGLVDKLWCPCPCTWRRATGLLPDTTASDVPRHRLTEEALQIRAQPVVSVSGRLRSHRPKRLGVGRLRPRSGELTRSRPQLELRLGVVARRVGAWSRVFLARKTFASDEIRLPHSRVLLRVPHRDDRGPQECEPLPGGGLVAVSSARRVGDARASRSNDFRARPLRDAMVKASLRVFVPAPCATHLVP